MAFQSIAGGFQLSAADQELVNAQRAITQRVNNQFIQVGAIFLKTSNKSPFDPEGWSKTQYRDTDLQRWIDDPDFRYHNVGFNLQLGWLDIDIDASDPEFNRCVLAALDYTQVDTRFRFGRLSTQVASHVFVQLGEEESQNFEALTKFEPREFRIGGKRFHVQLRSMATNVSATNLAKAAKQTVMPGSIYSHKTDPGRYDVSVWFGKDGVAKSAAQIAATTPRRVNFNEIVRAITFGTFLYCLRDHWVEGNRQTVAQKIGGWLARVVRDSQAMNNHEILATEVFCPVDTDATAESLLAFICEQMGDTEKHMRIRAYHDACEKLERNPDAKIPGWPALELLLGGERVVALRTVFTPGSDVSKLTQMAERYVYDESDGLYIDRQRFFSASNFAHEASDLQRRHKGDVIRIGGKPKEAFLVFESSDMRKRVGMRELYPELNPGLIYRISGLGEVLSDEDDEDKTALSVFNTWRGWPLGPPDVLDKELLEQLVARLDRVLGYLCRDNAHQIVWVKQWLAWTIQHPGSKQQIAWVVVGEQGIGKSWIGNIFVKALMGGLWGSAAPKVLEGDFNIGPFKDKMFVFIDEAKFHSEVGTDEIKKLIRGVDVPGMEKFAEARNYRLFSRIMFASNRMDMNIGQTNVRDRALFYTRAYDREFTHQSEMEFRSWAETLKPFFEEFTELMTQRNVREHFMYYFLNYPTDRHIVESIQYSSSSDAAIVMTNMGWPRRIAKYMIEEGRIFEDLDITFPFTITDLNKRVAELGQEMGMRGVQGARVMAEFQQAGVTEMIVVGGQKKYRFVHKIGSLVEAFGVAIGVPLEPRFEFDAEKDYGKNECDGKTRPPWKGNRPGVVAESKG